MSVRYTGLILCLVIQFAFVILYITLRIILCFLSDEISWLCINLKFRKCLAWICIVFTAAGCVCLQPPGPRIISFSSVLAQCLLWISLIWCILKVFVELRILLKGSCKHCWFRNLINFVELYFMQLFLLFTLAQKQKEV